MLTHPTQLQQTIDKETITKINEDYLRKHTVDIDIPILQNSSLPELFKRPANEEKGFAIYSDGLIDKLIEDIQLSELLSSEFNPKRVPVWAFNNQKLKEDLNGVEDLKLLCVTWNMHGSLLQSQARSLLNSEEAGHHIVVVCTQECQRSIPVSLFCESKQKWEAALSGALGNKYSIVRGVTMNALHMIIFAHVSVQKYVSAISVDSKATGIADLIGNKGGIGMSLEIGDKSFLFVNSHFASGQSNNRQRNLDYQKISSSLSLPKYYQNPNEALLRRFNYIFWMGDFNYRIEVKSKNDVDNLLNNKLYFSLLKRDQLVAQKKLGHIFQDFQEGLILFPPSYKMLADSNVYSSGADARIPGWTDRIVFKQKTPDTLNLLNYEMALNVLGSDHRPVFAQFKVKVKINPLFQPIAVNNRSDCCIF